MGLHWLTTAVAALAVAPLAATGVAHADVETRRAAECVSGDDAYVSKYDGDYTASFEAHGEELTVKDHASDGDAAVAYVKVYTFLRCRNEGGGDWSSDPIDTDRFVMSIGVDTYNLGTRDGTGNIAEDELVRIMVCRGYASIDGDNCSPWEFGIA